MEGTKTFFNPVQQGKNIALLGREALGMAKDKSDLNAKKVNETKMADDLNRKEWYRLNQLGATPTELQKFNEITDDRERIKYTQSLKSKYKKNEDVQSETPITTPKDEPLKISKPEKTMQGDYELRQPIDETAISIKHTPKEIPVSETREVAKQIQSTKEMSHNTEMSNGKLDSINKNLEKLAEVTEKKELVVNTHMYSNYNYPSFGGSSGIFTESRLN